MSMPTTPLSMAEHPEVLAIAVELILHPGHRQRYSPCVLLLADVAIDDLRRRLLSTAARTDDVKI
jgi:hypothetical protein